jgi:hypothetical protein
MSDYGLFSKCPSCGQLYNEIARHWKQSQCDYPSLTYKQKQIITGSLMGDGHLNKRNKTPILKLTMIKKEYLEYIDKVFEKLSCGVKDHKTALEACNDKSSRGFDASVENYNDQYIWYTRAIPELKEYTHWYQGKDNKVWPKNIQLTPTIFKHWYVQDGNFRDNSITISLCKEYDQTNKIKHIFDNSPIPKPDRHDKTKYIEKETEKERKQYNIVWNVTKSQEIFDMIPKSLPGFEYKWPNNSI